MIKTVLLPVALIVIMFGMGISLTLADFKRVFISPKAKIVGLVLQLLVLPLVAFALATLFRLPGELAVGLMVIAACPGGPTSNIISHLSKGDTALSVSLTATSSLITIFTIPLWVEFSLEHFLGSDTDIHLSFLKTVLQLMVVTLLPIGLGLLLNAKKPNLCIRLDKPVKFFSLFFLILIVVIAVSREEDLLNQFKLAGPAAISLNVLTMTLGFGVAWLLGLQKPQRITLAIETGIQNGTLALAISLGMLQNPRIAVPAVVYSLLMFATGILMILIFGRKTSEA
jgi:BASS family bile acid:Na+ symporter